MKVLIVEDNRLLSLMLCKMVERMNHTVIDTVTKAETAIETVKKQPVDLILMDIILDGKLDGIDAVHEIRKFNQIPVIYITSNSDPVTLDRVKQTNYIDYLIKPVSENMLSESIQKIG